MAGLYGSSTTQNISRVALAELVGTYFLVFAGTSVAVSASLGRPIAGGPADSLAVALTFGLALVALVNALGHVSGAHFNPAVTLGLAITSKFPWTYVPAYLVAQVVGAVLASLTVWATFGDAARDEADLAATLPAADTSQVTVLAIETIVTFFLVLTIVSVATDPRVQQSVAGLSVGFTLAVCVLIAGPLSGGAVNPARALGPMIVSGQFDGVWAYLLGPLLGGIAAAVFYAQFLAKGEEPSQAEAAEGSGTGVMSGD
jgi:MIP family channel proteins